MIFTSVREFKAKATQFLARSEPVVITKYGKPIAVLSPVEEKSAAALLLELREVLQEAGVSRKAALRALEEVRKEVYGS
jgi:prevent-host-death family protein